MSKTQDIAFWKDLLQAQPEDRIKTRLDDTLKDIRFLESIYMTGGANAYYSQQFKDAAHTERQNLCQLSSALYSILADRKAQRIEARGGICPSRDDAQPHIIENGRCKLCYEQINLQTS